MASVVHQTRSQHRIRKVDHLGCDMTSITRSYLTNQRLQTLETLGEPYKTLKMQLQEKIRRASKTWRVAQQNNLGWHLPPPPMCGRGFTRATTGVDVPPTEAFRRQLKNFGAQYREIYHVYFFILFTHVQFVTSYLGRSDHQVSFNDPTSHHLFATLRPRQSQSRRPSTLRVAGQCPEGSVVCVWLCDIYHSLGLELQGRVGQDAPSGKTPTTIQRSNQQL